MYRQTKDGAGYRWTAYFGRGRSLGAGILWDKDKTYAVLWGVRAEEHESQATMEAIHRVMEVVQDEQKWPNTLPATVQRTNVLGDRRCMYWALSRVEGGSTKEEAEAVGRRFAGGNMAGPPEQGWAECVLREVRVGTWPECLARVESEEIWGGVCEVGRCVQG